jgi:large subunit ribosomal protein L13
MDMNKAFFLRNEDRAPEWRHIDAKGLVLGRLATQVAVALRGKDRPQFTAHIDSGDYVVITNCDKIVLTGDKWDGKIYKSYSGWKSGLKELTARQVFEREPERLIRSAVKGMLPKGPLGRQLLKKLRVYVGEAHPHAAQVTPAKAA